MIDTFHHPLLDRCLLPPVFIHSPSFIPRPFIHSFAPQSLIDSLNQY